MDHTILVVEDEDVLQKYLQDILTEAGFMVKIAADGAAAIATIKKIRPDLVILDLGIPNVRGETVCIETKKMYPDVPVIILTAQNTTPDVVKGLNLGADDYMGKPFEADELVARVKTRLRGNNVDQTHIQVGDLIMDLEKIEVSRAEKKIELTPQEFKLLEYLMANKGKVLTRNMILNRLWLFSPDIDTRVVDVYIGYLRKKIDADHSQKLIQSVRGFGYVIKE